MPPPRLSRSMTTGICLALGTAVISGVSVFVNSFAVRQFGDPAAFTTMKNAVAALILVGAMLLLGGGVPRAMGARSWLALAVLGVIGGSVPFLLFFTGLAEASAPAAAVIHKTLFIWVALLGAVLLRERLGAWQLGALGVLLAATLMITPPTGVSWGGGETLIAIATGFWAVETIVARRVLGTIPPLLAGAGRMGFGLVVLVAYLAFTGRLGIITQLGLLQWAWVLGTGTLLAGYVATWYAALQRAPAAIVAAVLTIAAPITAGLSAVANGGVPAAGPLGGYGLILLAGAALVAASLRSRPRAVAATAAG